MTRRSLTAGVLVTMACVYGTAAGIRGQQPAGGRGATPGAPGGGGVQALVVDDAESARRGFKKPKDGPQTVAEYEALFKSISNWGRWGKDDQLGAMNLITDAKRKQAAGLVKSGIAVSLSHTLVTDTVADMPQPFELSGGGSTFKYSFHSTTHSHLDAICQFDYKGELFNGWKIKDTKSAKGCTTLDVDALKNGLTTRGVLIDIPRLRGVKYLEPGTPIYPEEIEAWEKKANLKIGPGDAIFLRTGRWLRRAEKGPWQLFPAPPGEGEAGYHVSCPAWFKKRDVAIVGADVSNDVTPHVEVAGEVLSLTRGMPVHSLTIVALGGIIIDALDLEAVAETAAKLNRWEFMVTGAPPRVVGGTGSLLNLTAIF